MAKKVWDAPIDKTVPWDGNSDTDNMPVRGTRVEEFIKETFEEKIGVLHYDVANNRYLAFADQANLEVYLADPTQTQLVLGTFDAPFNYSAEITLTSAAYNAVFYGSTGNYIDFTFDVKNKQGASTGENVTVTYTFIRNAVKQTFTETRKFGDNVHFNIDKYLGEGTNTIIVGITGQTTLAATTVAVTYQVVNLAISDNVDVSTMYNLSTGAKVMEVSYTVSGYGTKVVEWYIDGEQLPYVKVEDEVVDVSTTRTKYITLANLSQGTHSLQIRAYTTINGEKFYTDTIYRDIIVYTGVSSDLIIAMAATIPARYGVLGAGETPSLYDIIQYIPYELRFATYTSTNAQSTEVQVLIDGVLQGAVGSRNGVENKFTIISKTTGNKTLELKHGDTVYTVPIYVAETTMNLQEIKTDLMLDFSALGKSNGSPDRDVWEGNGYTGTLTGFNWNNTSGWVDNRLEMNAGSTFALNIAPLAGNPTSNGRTIEIEWSTKNVTNDDEVICDLRNYDGVGILITATKVSMRSSDGVVVETEYKSDENVRIGFVINRSSGVSNQRLSFIYANGIVSRGEKWAYSDSYTSDATILFRATEAAQVSLKSILVYNTALTSDQMLNNYTLYRDTVADMMTVYDRNDVYEDGTTVFSTDKMMSRLPVMIVTGDIPVLENTSDKDTQIVVNIDYYNMQDVSKSFRMVGAAMRPQGTSSMGYPKKNFRIYTRKVDGTVLYDANGNIVENKLYSFKDKAQPVDCWCLKADYAESSGSHNTGIARLWNDALFNATVSIDLGKDNPHNVDGEYVLRTEAQKKALAAGYPYDVRTTIDGFPILLFYRPTANDDLIFIGKYNFNNDKSTESVFGFTGIPDFDNSHMQCWEVLNNGNALALFTTTDGFDDGWSEAFESRYPDTKTPNTDDLKAFCEWMVNVSEEDFTTQKWEHMDVFKMAAYWCYLMRHAGADQFVKNAMFTSEDGQKFYYILYDNDTINGLINTGRLRIKPTDNRQTVDEAGAYVFAGHDSRLWNMLENDLEFMQIVSAVDNALYSSGISYTNTIKIFDEEQADKWVERVYNQDAQYKYVGPFVEKGIDNLFMLQGKRDLHRRWWLAKRFSIYDAKFVSGTYKSQAMEFKCINDTPAGQQFSITAGYPLDYGYGINNVPRSFGITLGMGESHTFTTAEVVNLGDPIRVYAAPNIAKLDLSPMSSKLAVVTVTNAYDEALGTKLTHLILGNASQPNMEVTEISGLKQAVALEYLDVQGMTKMTSIDLTNHVYFKTLKAFGSGVASVAFPKGAPVERLELPSAMRVLSLEQLPYITTANVVMENKANINSIVIKSCPMLSSDFDFAYEWLTGSVGSSGVFEMDSISWSNVPANKMIQIGEAMRTNPKIKLYGTVRLASITLEQIAVFRELFGDRVFDDGVEFQIKAPESIFLSGPTSIREGESAQFLAVVFSDNKGTVKYSIVSGSRSGVSINENTGLLTSTENGEADSTLVIRAVHTSTTGVTTFVDATLKILMLTYPTSLSISGNSTVNDGDTYTLTVSPTSYTGSPTFAWTLTGAAVNEGLIVIKEQSATRCVIQLLKRGDTAKSATLKCTAYKNDGTTVASSVTKSLTVAAYTYPTAITLSGDTSIKDGNVYTLAYTPTTFNGPITNVSWVLSGDVTSYVSLGERDNNQCILNVSGVVLGAATGTFTVIVTLGNGTELTASMDVLVLDPTILMTSVTNPNAMAVMYAAGLAANESYMTYDEAAAVTDSQLQSGTSYSTSIFYKQRTSAAKIENFDEFEYFTSLTKVPDYCFPYCTAMTSIKLPPQITSIGNYAFGRNSSYNTKKLSSITIPEGVTTILPYAFYYCSKLTSVSLPSTLTTIGNSAFSECSALSSISIPDSVTSLGDYAFRYCNSLNSVTIGRGVTKIAMYMFANNGALTSINIPSNVTTIAESAFYADSQLARIDGCSGVVSVAQGAFGAISPEATIDSVATFGLFKQKTGIQFQEIFSGESNITAILLGTKTFKAPTGAYFEDMSTSKDLLLSYTGGVEDLTDKLKIGYITLNITSNIADAEFSIAYTATDGTSKTVTKDVGTHILDIKIGSSATITPITEYEGYQYSAKTQTISSASTTVAMNYAEKVYIYIKHTNGNLYTTEDWSNGLSAGTLSNDNADGVCVMQAVSGGFVIAKDDASSSYLQWGGYGKNITGIESLGSEDAAVLDFDGADNTTKIIEQLAGYTDSQGTTGAPAAEACAAYVFPSGKTGYLPALGEWKVVYNNKTAVNSARSLIGGNSITNITYWSSTQANQNTTAWSLNWNNGSLSKSVRNTSNCKIRAFAPYGRLVINSTLATLFDVTYTNNQGKDVTRTVGIGATNFNVMMGSTMTITPRAIGNVTAEAQSITWDDTEKTVSFAFAKDAGVYIQHVDGQLFTESEWSHEGFSNESANGVAILSATAPAFVIAKAYASSSKLKLGGYYKTITDIVTTTSSATAVLDVDGMGNTQKIIEQLTGYTDSQGVVGAPAAEACAAYVFPNGKTGYLGALGEWQAANNNKTAVASAMSLIGGKVIWEDFHWTSTQYSQDYGWYLYWDGGSAMNSSSKSSTYRVRAFAAL